MLGQTIGGATAAFGKGWQSRVRGASLDSRGWGRMLTVKISGKPNRQLWFCGIYVAYANSPKEGEGFFNLQKVQMTENTSNEHMPLTNGEYDPHKLLRKDLDALLLQASQAGAEIVIYGDFNERWYQEKAGAQIKGDFRSWSENRNLKNILQSDSNTPHANATCFSNPSNPSDIDWILCSSKFAKTAGLKTWVGSYLLAGSQHRPVCLEFDAIKYFGLEASEVTNHCQKSLKVSSLRGPADGPFVEKFKLFHEKVWADSNASAALAKVKNKKFKHLPKKEKKSVLEKAYGIITGTFTKAMNKLDLHFQSGSRRNTYFSHDSVDLRMSIRQLGAIRGYLVTRLNSSHPCGSSCPRGKKRSNVLRRDSNVSLPELKNRVGRLGHKLFSTDLGSDEAAVKLASLGAELLLIHPKILTSVKKHDCPNQIVLYEKTCKLLDSAEKCIVHLLKSKSRKSRVENIHEAVKKRNASWGERKLRLFFTSILERPSKSPPISQIVSNTNETISDPKKLATHVVNFFEEWFGKNQTDWTTDKDGNPAHPIAFQDSRGRKLRQAMLDGKYYEVATAEEVAIKTKRPFWTSDLGLCLPLVGRRTDVGQPVRHPDAGPRG